MTGLSIIIVNYNVKYFVEQCLHSVFRSEGNLTMDVWVVDNASSDGSIQYLEPRFPQVHFIANKENVGFARANNQAIRQCTGRYVLLLNPDTFVAEDTLCRCVEQLDANPEIGATGVSMYGFRGDFALESRRSLPVPFTSFCKMTGLTRLFPKSRLFGRYYMQFLDPAESSPIEVISGAFNMLRREAIEKVGLLDEDYFMYGEDIDLSYSVMQAGWKNWYFPYPIVHYKGESTQKTSYRHVRNFYDAMLIFINKHFRKRYRFSLWILRAAVYLFATLVMIGRTIQRIIAGMFDHTPKVVRTLCLCRTENADRLTALCEQNNMQVDVVEASAKSRPHGHCTCMNLDHYRYVVYDSSAYRYADMIQHMRETNSLYPDLILGTYNPETGVVILPDKVIAP